MRARIQIVLVAAMLGAPSLAAAAPITTGVWSAVGTPAADGGEFWDNVSIDDTYDPLTMSGFRFNAGALLQRLYGPLEYLHDGANNPVAFAFDEVIPSFSIVATMTTWSGGIFTQEPQPDGSFTYDANQGLAPEHISNSLTNSDQFVLFRRIVPGAIEYFIGVEDIRFDLGPPPNTSGDRDYNDFIVSFRVPTQQAPEPALLLLLGTGLMVAGSRLRRRS